MSVGDTKRAHTWLSSNYTPPKKLKQRDFCYMLQLVDLADGLLLLARNSYSHDAAIQGSADSGHL
jgi:hypothetical protein